MRLADGELRNVYRRQVLTDYESDFQCAITHLPTSNDFFEIFALGTLKMPTWAIFSLKRRSALTWSDFLEHAA